MYNDQEKLYTAVPSRVIDGRAAIWGFLWVQLEV
jgi:hypothetical protein